MPNDPPSSIPNWPPPRRRLTPEEEEATRRIIEKAAHKFPQRPALRVPRQSNGTATYRTGRASFWKTKTGVILIGVGTALLSVLLGSQMWGWPFAIVLTILLFVHECGHAWGNYRYGIPVENMVFIPLLGAFVTARYTHDRLISAFIALMGPVFGAVGGIVCAGIGLYLHSSFWMELADIDFIITLANLLPIAPLDGSRIAPIFSTPRRSYAHYGPITAARRRNLIYGYLGLAALMVLFLYLSMHREPWPDQSLGLDISPIAHSFAFAS